VIASDPQKMLFAHASWPVKTDCQSPFTPSVKKRDDPNNPNSTGAQWARFRFSVVGSLLSSSPPRGSLKTAIRSLAAKIWTHPTSGRDVQFAAATIERWYYTAQHGHDDPVGALRRAVRKDRGGLRASCPRS
jgi:hypothetical protein